MTKTVCICVVLLVVAGCGADDSPAGARDAGINSIDAILPAVDGGTAGDAATGSADASIEEPNGNPANADATLPNPFGGTDRFYAAGSSTWSTFLTDLGTGSCGDRFFFERGGTWTVGPNIGNIASRSTFDCRGTSPVIVADYGVSSRPRPRFDVVQQGGAWGMLVDASEWSSDSLHNVQFYSLDFRCPDCTRAANADTAFFMNHAYSSAITFYNVRIDGFRIAIHGSSIGLELTNSQITNNISQGILGALPQLKVRGSLFENNGCRFLPRGSSDCIFEHALYQICAPSGEVPACDAANAGAEYVGNLFINNSITGSGADRECGGSNIVGLIGNGLRFESNVVATTLPISGNCFLANSGAHSWPGIEQCRDCRFNNNVMLNASVGFDLRTTQNAQASRNLFIFDAPSLGGNTTAISTASGSSGTTISNNLVRFVVAAPEWVSTGISIGDNATVTNNTINDASPSAACIARLATAGDPSTYALPIDSTVALASCRD